MTRCFIPFRSTWTGFDTFTFEVFDIHAGPPSIGVVSIEVEEP